MPGGPDTAAGSGVGLGVGGMVGVGVEVGVGIGVEVGVGVGFDVGVGLSWRSVEVENGVGFERKKMPKDAPKPMTATTTGMAISRRARILLL